MHACVFANVYACTLKFLTSWLAWSVPGDVASRKTCSAMRGVKCILIKYKPMHNYWKFRVRPWSQPGTCMDSCIMNYMHACMKEEVRPLLPFLLSKPVVDALVGMGPARILRACVNVYDAWRHA